MTVKMASGLSQTDNKNSVVRVILLSCVVLLLAAKEAESKPFDIASIIGPIAGDLIGGLTDEGELELFGHICLYKRTPYVYRWELHYRAEVRCLGWTPIIGKVSGHVNPTKAEQGAVKDFVKKALAKGLITQEEAQPWIEA